MNMKRIITAISAAAVLITSSLTATVFADSEGTRFPFPIEGLVDQNITTASTFVVEGAPNVVYQMTFDSVGWADAKVRNGDGSDGNRSLRIRGTGTVSKSKGLGAELTVKFGNPTNDGQYVISFDLYREQSSSYDYATLNYDGWDSTARLSDNTLWTVTQLGAGNSIGGAGNGSWSRYTATLSTTADDPQLNFAVADGGELHIDNIIVKDTSDNVLFAESFESAGPIIAVPEEDDDDEPDQPGGNPDEPGVDPDEPAVDGTRFPFPLEGLVDQNITTSSTYLVEGAENVVYQMTFDSAGSPDAKVRNGDGSDGNRSMRIRGTDTISTSKGLGAEFTIKFGKPTTNGKYVISFDLYRELSSSYDYATLNYDGWEGPARLSGTTMWTVTPLGVGNSIGGVGNGNWSRYTATLSTTADDPQLNFAVAKGGELHIDNIIVKDTLGNVLFAESFESTGPIIEIPKFEYLGYGLYAGDERQESINGATTYTAKVSVVNNGIAGGIKAQIFAILRKDGEMVDIQGSDLVTIPRDATNQEGIEVSTTIAVGDISDGEYEISVYFWDGLENMKILTPSKVYKESE